MIWVIDPHNCEQLGIRKDDLVKTLLAKWEQVYTYALEDDHLIAVAGDYCESSRLGERIKTELNNQKKSFPALTVATSYGNHDEDNHNPHLRDYTSLNNLISAGTVVHSKTIEDFYGYVNLDFCENIHEFIQNNDVLPSVMGAHLFYDNEFYGGLDHNITPEMAKDLADKGVVHLVLGHDHQSYPVVELISDNGNKIYIHRPGALLRKKRKKYELTRKLEVLKIDMNTLDFEYLPIKAREFKSVIKNEKLFETENVSAEVSEALAADDSDEALDGLLESWDEDIEDLEKDDLDVEEWIHELEDEEVSNLIIKFIERNDN